MKKQLLVVLMWTLLARSLLTELTRQSLKKRERSVWKVLKQNHAMKTYIAGSERFDVDRTRADWC